MKIQIQIDYRGTAKVFDHDYGLTTADFWSLEINPFIGKKELKSFELLFSNLVDGEVLWDSSNINRSAHSSMGKLVIKGRFVQDIQADDLLAALNNPLTKDTIDFKSATVYILIDENAEDEWDRTRSLALKENGGLQKLKMTMSVDNEWPPVSVIMLKILRAAHLVSVTASLHNFN